MFWHILFEGSGVDLEIRVACACVTVDGYNHDYTIGDGEVYTVGQWFLRLLDCACVVLESGNLKVSDLFEGYGVDPEQKKWRSIKFVVFYRGWLYDIGIAKPTTDGEIYTVS